MRYFNIKSMVAVIAILYLLEVIVVSSSKPVGEDYLKLLLKYEKVEVIKVYPLYQDDASMLTLIRSGEGIIGTMKHLAFLFYFGGSGRANNSIEGWEFRTPGGNVSYYPKMIMGINSHGLSPLYPCSKFYNNRTGSQVLEDWGSIGFVYYPFLHKEYYSEKWANMNKTNFSNNLDVDLATPDKAWAYYTNMIEDEKAWGFYNANLLKGYTFEKDLRAVYYYGSDGKLIVDTQLFSGEELKSAHLFVDGERKNFEVESSVLIVDAGNLESGRHYVRIDAGSLSKRLDFDVEWIGISTYKLDMNGTLFLGFINRRNESVVLKKVILNDTTVNINEQLPVFGEGLIYRNESSMFTPPDYNVYIPVPVGKEDSIGDCRLFNLAVEYSLQNGSIIRDEWENFDMRFEGSYGRS